MKSQTMYLKMTLCLLLLLSLGLTSVARAHPLRPQGGSPAFPYAQDIGDIDHTGATIANGDAYRIWGSGSDIGGHNDQFQYTWATLPSDGQVVAQVLSQGDTDGWAKAGIMLRETLDDNAANVFLALTPEHGVTFQWRSATNERTRHRPGPPMQVPSWLKLVRYAQTVTGFVSADGSTWTRVSSITIPMQASSIIGLAVTAHNNQTRSRAVFTHAQLTLGSMPPSQTAAQVYGQAGCFVTNTNNNGNISATSLHNPWAVASDTSGNLYIADSANARVLYYPAGGSTATHVYGQDDCLTSDNSGTSATSLIYPLGVALDTSGNLFVADYDNSRVLYYPAGSTTATGVYGQGGDFTTGASNKGVSATSLSGPTGVALDTSGNLFVADYGNNRVLKFPQT